MKRNNEVNTWSDRKILSGKNWGSEISENLELADIIILLISQDFMISDYCFDIELERAIERHQLF